MQLNKNELFYDGVAVGADTAGTTSTLANSAVLDLHFNGDDRSRVMSLFIQATGDTPTGTGTVSWTVQTSSDKASWTDIATYPAKAASAFDANGMIVSDALPTGIKRYLKLVPTFTGLLTGLTVTAGINLGIEEPFDKDWLE